MAASALAGRPTTHVAARIWWGASLLMLAAAALHAPMAGSGPFAGGPVAVPLSLALHLASLALLTRVVLAAEIGAWLVGVAWAAAGAGLFAALPIAPPAAGDPGLAGVPAMPIEAVLRSLSGIAAVILLLAAAIVGALALLRPRDGVGSGLRWGTVLGLGSGVFLSLGQIDPVTADLRLPPFTILHSMLAAPLAGWLADRHGRFGIVAAIVATLVMIVLVGRTMN